MSVNESDDICIQQRLFPTLPCFGCGPANERGLQLRSYPRDEQVIAQFTPWPEHNNGLGYLNGGIIATVLDCHSAAVVIHEADKRGWAAESTVPLPYVTAGLDLSYLRPSPLDQTVHLLGRIILADENEMTAEVELVWDGKPRARASAVWKRWRPR